MKLPFSVVAGAEQTNRQSPAWGGFGASLLSAVASDSWSGKSSGIGA